MLRPWRESTHVTPNDAPWPPLTPPSPPRMATLKVVIPLGGVKVPVRLVWPGQRSARRDDPAPSTCKSPCRGLHLSRACRRACRRRPCRPPSRRRARTWRTARSTTRLRDRAPSLILVGVGQHPATLRQWADERDSNTERGPHRLGAIEVTVTSQGPGRTTRQSDLDGQQQSRPAGLQALLAQGRARTRDFDRFVLSISSAPRASRI